jgi:hypothetical protein
MSAALHGSDAADTSFSGDIMASKEASDILRSVPVAIRAEAQARGLSLTGRTTEIGGVYLWETTSGLGIGIVAGAYVVRIIK